MYDVVIIGARCAGSALALMLAPDGLNVLTIDRTTFPGDEADDWCPAVADLRRQWFTLSLIGELG